MTAWPLPPDTGPVLDLAARGPGWLILTAAGTLLALLPGREPATALATDVLIDEPDHDPWRHALTPRLHVSACGRFAAVANDYGRYGHVLDLEHGRTTLRLDGGDYRPDTVPLSVTFARHAGRVVVVHRTAWNRLDVHDAETGRLLTDRPDPTGTPHYLDYFHGRLLLSPDGRHLADDGWVWQPLGLPQAWSLERWLGGNVWESEDGPSGRALGDWNETWDAPMCFVGDDLIALSGAGPDLETRASGVRIIDVTTGEQVRSFPGPAGALFADDRRLYSAGPDGLQIWDPATGQCTGSVPGFVPTTHHRSAGLLAAVRDGDLLGWSTR